MNRVLAAILFPIVFDEHEPARISFPFETDATSVHICKRLLRSTNKQLSSHIVYAFLLNLESALQKSIGILCAFEKTDNDNNPLPKTSNKKRKRNHPTTTIAASATTFSSQDQQIKERRAEMELVKKALDIFAHDESFLYESIFDGSSAATNGQSKNCDLFREAAFRACPALDRLAKDARVS